MAGKRRPRVKFTHINFCIKLLIIFLLKLPWPDPVFALRSLWKSRISCLFPVRSFLRLYIPSWPDLPDADVSRPIFQFRRSLQMNQIYFSSYPNNSCQNRTSSSPLNLRKDFYYHTIFPEPHSCQFLSPRFSKSVKKRLPLFDPAKYPPNLCPLLV